jgi:hypothetical protein
MPRPVRVIREDVRARLARIKSARASRRVAELREDTPTDINLVELAILRRNAREDAERRDHASNQ